MLLEETLDFEFIESPDLPPLAWVASVDLITGHCLVERGSLVETGKRFFVEGVWSGLFAEGQFDDCESFFGSGAVRRPTGDLVFVPSSATVDYLYFKEILTELICSNSLPALLAALDDRLDEFNSAYGAINASIKQGIERYKPKLPTRCGEVTRLMYHNLVVVGGKLRREAKALPPAFTSFEQYRNYFAAKVAGIMINARDPTRATPLRILSTQSSGYDSTAVNAIARDYGLKLTLSIDESKEQNYFRRRKTSRPSDSGAEIGRRLGLEVCLIDRRNFTKGSEYLYWAGLHHCPDMNLHQVREYVGRGAVLLTGVLGELWYNKASTPNDRLSTVDDQLQRWDLSCHGLSEARLHFGFVHAPAPYIGARSRVNLFNIANGDAMREWSIGGTYDRPIPRRIGEEAGLPRELFGQRKLATVVEFIPPYLPFGKTLRSDFYRFVRQKRGIVDAIWMFLASKTNAILLQKVDPFYGRIVRRFSRIPFIGRLSPIPSIGARFNAVLYAYCVNRAVDFYRPLLSSNVSRRLHHRVGQAS